LPVTSRNYLDGRDAATQVPQDCQRHAFRTIRYFDEDLKCDNYS